MGWSRECRVEAVGIGDEPGSCSRTGRFGVCLHLAAAHQTLPAINEGSDRDGME